MKLYCEPITVYPGANGKPASLRWRLQYLKVLNIEEVWDYAGRWWTTPSLQGAQRRYFRLLCRSSGGHQVCLEVFRETTGTGEQWKLSRLLD